MIADDTRKIIESNQAGKEAKKLSLKTILDLEKIEKKKRKLAEREAANDR